MNIHEYQAKQLFRSVGIAVPNGDIASSPLQARQLAEQLGGERWVVKAQIHAGARGKAGGVVVADTVDAVEAAASRLLGSRLVTVQTGAAGLPVNQVLIECATAVEQECYLSLLIDRERECLVFIASAAGGMDIEAVAAQTPERICRSDVPIASGLQAFNVRQVATALGLNSAQQPPLHAMMDGLLRLFLSHDCSQIEINPLITTADGRLLALDGKINLDDNALAAHPDLMAWRDSSQEDPTEAEAQLYDLNYISLGGTIGCMVNGAGLAMATMDEVTRAGGEPANFLDVGGGTTKDKVKAAFKLITADPKVNAVLVNIFGGIVHCDVIAAGMLAALDEMALTIPLVVRLEGTHAEQGRALLAASGLAGVYTADDLTHAAEQAVALTQASA